MKNELKAIAEAKAKPATPSDSDPDLGLEPDSSSDPGLEPDSSSDPDAYSSEFISLPR